jgi:hypothetical protein
LNAGDLYEEGWLVEGFWSYWISDDTNPFDGTGSDWGFASTGMSGRNLVDGDWDGWSYAPGFASTAPSIPQAAVVPEAVDGDFNGDGLWNCVDINALSTEIAGGDGNLAFDMNGDGMMSLADITDPADGWLAVGGANNPTQTGGNAFLNGDADLSGAVDGSDFGAWNSNKFSSSSAWCDGDFDASGGVDGSDFGVWNVNKFQTSDNASAVPEPVAFLSWLMLLGYIPRCTKRLPTRILG